MMMHRLCHLCQMRSTTNIHNLRTYTVSSILGQTHADIIETNVFDKIRSRSHQVDKKNPIIVCKRKEFNFYPGTVYKKFDTIRIASAGWHHYKSRGDYFTINPVIKEDESTETKTFDECTFHDFDLHPVLIKNLAENGLYKPTVIQRLGIPEISAGQNITIAAETGCGKTLTYLLPIVNQILKWKPVIMNRSGNTPLALIITPSRELAHQIAQETKKLVKGLDIDIKMVLSGRTRKYLLNPAVRNVDILIGTIGVLSKLTTWQLYKLHHLRHTVIDEAHALFDESFDEKMQHFLKKINFGFKQLTDDIPLSSQLTLASATIPDKLPEYISHCINPDSLIKIKTPNLHRILVPQKFLRLRQLEKPPTLLKLIKSRALHKQPTLIFSNASSTSDWISIFLNHMNIKATSLNGNMSDEIRKDKFGEFQRGEVNILSATNTGARGLDTTNVDFIINYDFPMNTADYIHRCGRTGRIGGITNGRVINFISRKLEVDLVMKIENSVRRGNSIPIFDIVQQYEEKLMDRELKDLLKSE